MPILNKCFLVLGTLVFFNFFSLSAQETKAEIPSVVLEDSIIKNNNYRIGYKQLIVPTLFIGIGFASLDNHRLKDVNTRIKKGVLESGFKRTKLDDYSQYVPAAAVYGLNALGIKGEHNYRGITIIYATSMLVSSALVTTIKRTVKEPRPDGGNRYSFPSGHTSTAFVAAHFMYKEYRNKNFWLSISGYPFAVFTGVYRVINNRHWASDVVAGAGFGILSTELGYWLYPKINKIIPGGRDNKSAMMLPFYKEGAYGVSIVKNF